jgi:hypothetical protein
LEEKLKKSEEKADKFCTRNIELFDSYHTLWQRAEGLEAKLMEATLKNSALQEKIARASRGQPQYKSSLIQRSPEHQKLPCSFYLDRRYHN